MRFFRVIARPLSVLALLALAAPSWAECRPAGRAAPHQGMSCCLKADADQGKIDSGCCTVGRSPKPQQPPATTVGIAVPAPIDAPAVNAIAIVPALAPALSGVAIESGPPGPPLYLRLSVIRR